MARILVTGASGFIGSALADALKARGQSVRAAYRQVPVGARDAVSIGDLGPGTDWREALNGVEAVIHLAGPAHAAHPKAYLQRTIVDAAATLTAQAGEAGVTRFIFISSIKAARARTQGGAVSETDRPAPEDGYGRAKLAAERAVLACGALNPVVLRPPLVIAPNAKGNLAHLLRLAATPLPLPLANITNSRSLIARETLIAAIVAALGEGPTGVFHVADRPPLSSPEIVGALREGMGRAPNLIAHSAVALVLPRVLMESLEIDDTLFRATYGYGGDIGAHAALVACAAAWKAAR